MKKLLCTAACFFALFTAQAQIPDGSIAPDFTVTDLNGVTHSLSAYLAQGKTVIIDISATWCSPCWNYHESGALEQLYYTYGPEGSDEVVVLFIEGDGYTSIESLYGTNMPGDSGVTAGNWMEHSPYPVVDSDDVAALYEINYFPTIFRICPDGKVNEIPQLDFAGLRDNINANCQVLTPLQQHAKALSTDYKVCEGGTFVPQVNVKNYGTETITSAIIEIKQGGTILATKNYTGAIAVFDDAMVTFDPIALEPGTGYEAVITTINGSVPGNVQTATALFNISETVAGHNNITVKLHTNNYPSEMSWAIKDSAGQVVGSGGPYQAGNDDFFGGGGPDANTIKTQQITLPGTDIECYSVAFYSSSGYGWIASDAPAGMEIFSGDDVIFSRFVKNFGSVLVTPSAFKTNGTLSSNAPQATPFAMYPNPTTGVVSFNTQEAIQVTIIDMTGKIVYTSGSIANGGSINLDALQKGMYLARIQSPEKQWVEKVIVK